MKSVLKKPFDSVQWKGDNLKEVKEFFGDSFNEWGMRDNKELHFLQGWGIWNMSLNEIAVKEFKKINIYSEEDYSNIYDTIE